MNTKMAFDRMAKVLPYACELLNDDDVVNFKKAMKNMDDENPMAMGEAINSLMPVFLVKKPDVLFAMLGALSGKTADDVAEQDWKETQATMKDAMLGDFFDFFTFALRMAAKA